MQISPDGLIRLSIEQLLSTPLTHLVSGLDVDPGAPHGNCGRQTTLSGYTEWVSANEPTISIGWDWRSQPLVDGHRWTRVGLPRSNLMLTRDTGRDTSWHGNLEILGSVVDALSWPEVMTQAIAARYA